MGDFSASTGTDRDGYETCVGPHGSGTVNLNSTKFVDFARSYGLRVAGSWFQHPEAHRWAWYSNAGGVAKEIDHVFVDGRWRMIQKLHLKFRRMVPSQPRLDVDKLKDERVAEEFTVGS